MTFALTQNEARAIEQRARRGYPEEICGLLAGITEGGSFERRVVWSVPIDNICAASRQDRFELDPKQHLAAQRRARAEGLDLIGAYHSHPDGEAIPSSTDVECAYEVWGGSESWSHLLVGVKQGEACSIRSWIMRGDAFAEERIECI